MISVIIPIYNQSSKLSACLDSILKQTYKNIEVIVVDDASKDNSRGMAEIYKANFSKARISYKIFKHESNRGAPAARNTGFRNSHGEFLFFCDADAVLKPEALKIMRDELRVFSEASYAFPSFLWGRKLFKVGVCSNEKIESGPCIHTMALIRREHFPKNGWDESIKKFQDWDLWLNMLEAGHTGRWIDKILFTITPGGTMSSWLPAFAYKFFQFLPQVKRYNELLKIVKRKHKLK